MAKLGYQVGNAVSEQQGGFGVPNRTSLAPALVLTKQHTLARRC